MNSFAKYFLFAYIFSITQGTILTVGPSGNYSTILQALTVAVDDDVVELEAQVYSGTSNRNFDLTPFANISVVGQGSGLTTIDCELSTRFFYLTSSLSERNIHISGLKMKGCRVNAGTLYGGAIYIKNNFTTITLDDVVFENCSTSQGGAFYAEGYTGQNSSLGHPANIRMNNVQFNNNSASIGGAIWFVRADVLWTGGGAANNTATGDAGAIWLDDGTNMLAYNVLFQTNYADDFGGAGRLDDLSTFNGTNVQFINNKSGREGGGLWGFRAYMYCTSCYSSGNQSPYGGTFYNAGNGFASFSSCTFENGFALIRGGFAQTYNGADMELIDCVVRNCSASVGGAFVVNQQSELSLVRTTVSDNSAIGDGEGGAFYLIYKAKLELIDSIISGNTAASKGAGVWCGDSTIIISGTTDFTGNVAPSDNDIHCSTVISGSYCDIKGGDYEGTCDQTPVEEPFKTGYIILIAVVGGLVLIMILIGVMVVYFRRDKKKKIQTGKLWENMEENKDAKDDEKTTSEAKTESKRDSKRESKRSSKRDSKRESKTDNSSRASLQESEASEKKSGSESDSTSE